MGLGSQYTTLIYPKPLFEVGYRSCSPVEAQATTHQVDSDDGEHQTHENYDLRSPRHALQQSQALGGLHLEDHGT